MSKRCGFLLFYLGAWLGCGDAGSGDPCEASEDASAVTVRVASPLPNELGQACAGGAGTVKAFLTIPGAPSCAQEISSEAVQGCCPGVATNQNVRAVLLFQTESRYTLAEQGKNVELPDSGAGVVEVSFSGSELESNTFDADADGESNLSEYCAGTL